MLSKVAPTEGARFGGLGFRLNQSSSSLIWSSQGLNIPAIVPRGIHYWVGD